MPPLRVAHIITGLGVGGAERMLERLVTTLDPARFESLVISLLDEGTLGPRLAAAGVRVQALGMSRGLPDPRALFRLTARLRAFRPALVQTWLYHADLLGGLAARAAGVRRLVWNLRAAELDDASRRTRVVIRTLALLSRLPTAIIANSERARRVHEALGYRCPTWAIIPNGFDTDVFRPLPWRRAAVRAALGLGPGPVVMLIGRDDPAKDHTNLLEAMARVRTVHPDAELVLAGRGVTPANPALGATLARLALRGVQLLGERADVPDLLAAADVFALSSANESFPNVVGEAMACGVPCVVTDVGNAAELVGATGRVVPPRAPAALAAALLELLALPAAARAALGAAARDRIGATYRIDRVVATYARLYETLTAGLNLRPGVPVRP